MIKRLIVAFVLLLVVSGSTAADTTKKSTREPFGLRLGMNEEDIHRRLQKIATKQKEEREEEEGGEQEVWILKNDPRFSYLLTRFDRSHSLMFVTVVTRPEARVRYEDIGKVKDATVNTDGRTYSYRWKVKARGRQRPSVVIARGSNREFLTSFSIYFGR